jgi:hypothetical protein
VRWSTKEKRCDDTIFRFTFTFHVVATYSQIDLGLGLDIPRIFGYGFGSR